MKKNILIIIFIIYILVLLKITVLRNTFGLFHLFTNGKLYIVPAVNLIDAYKNCTSQTFIYLFLGNIIWFVPFGFLLPAITKLNNAKIIILGALTSFFIEFMQYAFGTGISEIV
jgi:glycopeptide antibiotics resistance protein